MSKWKTVRLGDVCEILNGYAFKSDKYVDSGIRVIRITNVQKGFIEDNSPAFYPITEKENIKDYELYENDLLISLTGNVGRVAQLSKEMLPAALNQRVGCIRIKDNNLLISYLFTYLNSDKFESDCVFSARGIAQKNMSTEWLKKYLIPLPSIEEQKKMALELEKCSKLISKYQKQLLNFDTLIKSRFIEMFGDPVLNEKGWEMRTLPELGEFGRGVSKHRPRNAPELLGGKYPLIQTGDVANANLYITNYESTYSEEGLKQSKMWKAGTLCITIAATIAKTAILTFDSCFPDSVVGFTPNENTNSLYINYWFTFFQKILEEQAPAVAQKNINLQVLSELKIITPPIELQNDFASFVQQIDKSKFAVQKSLKKAETLYKSLMQEYFG